jgi:hypothetical protein
MLEDLKEKIDKNAPKKVLLETINSIQYQIWLPALFLGNSSTSSMILIANSINLSYKSYFFAEFIIRRSLFDIRYFSIIKLLILTQSRKER